MISTIIKGMLALATLLAYAELLEAADSFPLDYTKESSHRLQMNFQTPQQSKKCAKNAQISTDLTFRIQRDNSRSASTIKYLRLDTNVVETFSFMKGGGPTNIDHTHVSFDGKSLTCKGNKRGQHACNKLPLNKAVRVVLLSIDFNPRVGSAWKGQSNRNRYTIKGTHYRVNCGAPPRQIVSATADFYQQNFQTVRAHGVQGHMLSNGNFIFYWINDGMRKMVLTTNDGRKIKSGYVMKGDSSWTDVSKWAPYGYSISNFKGIAPPPQFTSATADFSQGNLPGVRAHGVQGHMLENGNFIFYWINGPYRKMVLTTNDGRQIKSGWVKKDDSSWTDISKWQPYGYSISNFKGIMKEPQPQPHVSCTWTPYTSGNGQKLEIGSVAGDPDQCAVQCYQKSHTHQQINGATVRNNDKMCWCQLGMTQKVQNHQFTSCIFQVGHADTQEEKLVRDVPALNYAADESFEEMK